MIISVASGKGGTGKTTVTASLASIWDAPITAMDLDVEEPNLHLFLNPDITTETTITLEIPVVDESKCTHCRICSEFCQYKAITVMAETLLTFPEMCHGCGGCIALCPEDALSPGSRELGVMLQGTTQTAGQAIPFLSGRLRVGEAMSPPLMRAVKDHLRDELEKTPMDAIIDAPPGVSCPAMSAVMDSDYIVLVTEPTPFGFYDFKLAYEAFAPFGKPMGAVINRAGLGDDTVAKYCHSKNLPILAEIPYDRKIAEGYSKGEIIANLSPSLKDLFHSIRNAILSEEQQKEPAHV